MAVVENQLIAQLKVVGDRLVQPPSSNPELLTLLDELELLLSTVEQSPPYLVQEALLLPKKALIADELLRNSDEDVKFTVASCLNEIMRISAPDSPYDDEKMKEIFEIIVSSFDKLSSMAESNRCYSKAVSILDNVARVRSCVLMLDIGCDPPIIIMFELFLKNISSDHPHSVFLAMETIMTTIIKETEDDEPLVHELLKVLLSSIRKGNEISYASFKLGAKVIKECAEELKPLITETLMSMGHSVEDYAPILSLICNNGTGFVNAIVPALQIKGLWKQSLCLRRGKTAYN